MQYELIGLGIIVFFALYVILIHNNIVRLEKAVKESWAGIQVQLEKKIDLIPNLVKILKSYGEYESNLLQKITEIRENVSNPSQAKKIENELEKDLNALKVKIEAYPDLKASSIYLDTQRQLNEIESDIAAARRIYNMSVKKFNQYIKYFPNVIIANIEGKKEKDFFMENRDLTNEAKNVKMDL